MNGLGIKKAPKNDKDTAILTPDEVALLRTHASDGTLTAEERELYSKHLEAMKKSVPGGRCPRTQGREGIDYRRFGDARPALRHQRVSALCVALITAVMT